MSVSNLLLCIGIVLVGIALYLIGCSIFKYTGNFKSIAIIFSIINLVYVAWAQAANVFMTVKHKDLAHLVTVKLKDVK